MSRDAFTKGTACRIKNTASIASRFPDLVGKLGYVEEVSGWNGGMLGVTMLGLAPVFPPPSPPPPPPLVPSISYLSSAK